MRCPTDVLRKRREEKKTKEKSTPERNRERRGAESGDFKTAKRNKTFCPADGRSRTPAPTSPLQCVRACRGRRPRRPEIQKEGDRIAKPKTESPERLAALLQHKLRLLIESDTAQDVKTLRDCTAALKDLIALSKELAPRADEGAQTGVIVLPEVLQTE